MTDDKQAVKTLAESLVKAMKSVSANTPSRNYSGGASPSTIQASKIVGLPAAFSSIISGIESSAAAGDAVAQQTLSALNHIAAGEFETITADTAMIEKVYATFGDFITLVAEDATIGDLDVETIRAGLAEVGLINIGTASIDMAQIKRSSTQTAFIHESVQGKVYIDDLAVSDASIVNLAAGTVLINNSDGELVELYVDSETGDVSTRPVSYDGNDIINSNTLNGNRIVQNSITTDRLNVNEIFASSATVMNLIGDNIDASRINTGVLSTNLITALSPNVSVGGQTIEQIATSKANIAEQNAAAALSSAVNSINSDISNLQSQIDGNITTWFYAVDPTGSNAPAVDWNTTEKKNMHLGDLYYNTESGYCWRWQLSNSVYSWQRITDTDVTKALADAAEAKDVADSKRRIFITTPVPPYDEGDLWTQGNSGDILVCINGKETGIYVSTDWEIASKYTDDTVANNALLIARTAIKNVDVEYAKNQSTSVVPTSGWQTTAPAWEEGYYIWQRTKTTTSTGYSYSDPTCISGRDGVDGQQGPQGIPGTSITVASIQYAEGNSGTSVPSSGWQSTVPNVPAGKWLWVKTTYSDNSIATTCSYMGTDGEDGNSVAIQSVTKTGKTTTVVLVESDGTTKTLTIDDGTDGANGTPGANGYVHTAWANSADGTVDFSTRVSANKKYLGVYTDNTAADSTNPSMYSWSLIKGADGTSVSVLSTTTSYASSSSGTNIPSTGWQNTVPSVAQGEYLWTRVITTFSDNNSATSYTASRQGANGTNGTDGKNGVDGKDGKDGTDGVSPTVTSTSVKYQQSSTGTTPPTGTWQDVAPAATPGYYMWTKTTVTYSDNATSVSYNVSKNGTNGINGIDGTNGINTATVYLYQRAASAPNKPSDTLTYTFASHSLSGSIGNWSTSVPSGSDPCWVIAATAASSSATDTITATEWSSQVKLVENGAKGDKGDKGDSGDDGLNQATIYLYQRASSAPSKPNVAMTYTFASGVLSNIPTGWSRTIPSGTTPCWVTSAVAISTGDTDSISANEWADVIKLVENGVGISSITEYYALNNSTTAPADSEFNTTVKTPTSSNKYVWNYELITYTNSTTSKTDKHIIANYAADGTSGRGINSITEYYAINNSTTAPADSAFGTNVVVPTSENKYLWNYELISYTSGNPDKTAKRVIGIFGDKGNKGDKGDKGDAGAAGNKGDTGVGVSEIVEQYYLSTSISTQTGGSWQETQPEWVENKYIWTRSKVTWTDNTITYTTPVLAYSINKANEVAYESKQLSLGNTASIQLLNESVDIIGDSIEFLSTNAGRTYIQASTPIPNFSNDTWFNPVAEEHYISNGVALPLSQFVFGQDENGNFYNDHSDDYQFSINSDGELRILVTNEDAAYAITTNDIDFNIHFDYINIDGLWKEIKNTAFSNLKISVDGIVSEVYDSNTGTSRIEQNADRIIAIVSGDTAVPYVKTSSIEIKENKVEIQSAGNVDIKASNFSISFNTNGALTNKSRVDISNNVGIKVSDSYGNYFQATSTKIGLFDIQDNPRLYMDNTGHAFFNGSLTLGGANNVNGSMNVKNANGNTIMLADNSGLRINNSSGTKIGSWSGSGIEVYNSTGSIKQFYIDSTTGNATFKGAISLGGSVNGSMTIYNAGGTKIGSWSGSGIEVYNSTGSIKQFYIDSSTGNATFKGALSAATGTFAGSLSAATGTFSGTLSAACITSGTMSAARISGGTLTLGGSNNTNGQLVVNNASNSKVFELNKDGISIYKGSTKQMYINTTGDAEFSGKLNSAGGTFCGEIIVENTSNYSKLGSDGITQSQRGFADSSYTTNIINGKITQKYVYSAGEYTAQLDPFSGLTVVSVGAVSDFSAVNFQNASERIDIYSWGIYGYKLDDESQEKRWLSITSNGVYVDGTKSRLVKTSQYSNRLLYCYETPSPLFGDVGEGVISSDGKCYISLDPVFAQTISTDQYQVFLQPYGEGNCYISERHGNYFVVSGTPNLSFGWELKAKQSDFDQLRLERNDEKFTVPRQTYGEDAASHIRELYDERTQQDKQESEEK